GALAGEAKALAGGAVELRSARPPDAAVRGALDRLRGEGATTTAVRELAAMARNPANGASLLVELKAVEAGYPLYGRVELALSRPLGELIGDGRSALVERSLLERLGLAVGDPLLLGTARFTIAGVIDREPDRA